MGSVKDIFITEFSLFKIETIDTVFKKYFAKDYIHESMNSQ